MSSTPTSSNHKKINTFLKFHTTKKSLITHTKSHLSQENQTLYRTGMKPTKYHTFSTNISTKIPSQKFIKSPLKSGISQINTSSKSTNFSKSIFLHQNFFSLHLDNVIPLYIPISHHLTLSQKLQTK